MFYSIEGEEVKSTQTDYELWAMTFVLLLLLDDTTGAGYALPEHFTELRRQLAPIPLRYDSEGRLILPPKHKTDGSDSKIETMVDLIGCSPDEADALVLATFGIMNKPNPQILTTV